MTLPKPGETFDNRYKIEREIGRGGFATVFLATSATSGAQVALKILTPGPDGTYEQTQRRRFLREARVLAEVEHPHVAQLLHFGEAGPLLYLATEYVEGSDLAAVLRERRFGTDEAVHILEQLLAALSETHRTGLIHRDLKPENVRVSPTPGDPLRVKLLDFGIARATDAGAPALTKTSELVGTPRYMAPEQLMERPATPASDIYALGIIGFELLLGRDALHGGAWGDQLDRLQTRHLVAVDRHDQIEPWMLRVLQRMTTVNPEARYQSANAVLRALRADEAKPVEATPHIRYGAIALVVVALVVALVGASSVILKPSTYEKEVRARPMPRILTEVQKPPLLDGPPDAGSDIDFGAHASVGCSDPFEDPLGGGVRVRVPDACEGRACPLVIAFHANFMSPTEMVSLLGEQADRYGFLLVAPDGGTRSAVWQASAEQHTAAAQSAYKDALLSSCVDRSRVFLVGYSDGVDPVVQSRCEAWVTATAVFGSTFRPSTHENLEPGFMCSGGSRPTLWMHPKESGQVPWDTGPTCVRVGDVKLGYNDIIGVLRRLHGCSTRSDVVDLGSGTSCEAWRCERGLTSCAVAGGRLWPGTTKDVLDDLLGRCEDPVESRANIGDVMWSFFESVESLSAPPAPASIVPPINSHWKSQGADRESR